MREERAREKHRALVQKHARLMAKREKIIAELVRLEAQAVTARKAIGKSQKRLDKLVVVATYTGGPTASAVDDLIAAVDAKGITL